MTFLGIGPGELFVLLIILLVIVGPERLPGFARQLGRGIVSLRNWVQRSPDAQLFLRAKDELEGELRAIRDDLNQEMESVRQEMQTVREEMIQATREATMDVSRQIDDVTVVHNGTALSAHVERSAASQPATQVLPAFEAELGDPSEFRSMIAETTAELDTIPEPAIAPPQLLQANQAALSDAHTVPAAAPETNGIPAAIPRNTKPNAPGSGVAAVQPTSGDIEELREQLASVSREMQALREQMRQIQHAMKPIDTDQHAVEVTSQSHEASI